LARAIACSTVFPGPLWSSWLGRPRPPAAGPGPGASATATAARLELPRGELRQRGRARARPGPTAARTSRGGREDRPRPPPGSSAAQKRDVLLRDPGTAAGWRAAPCSHHRDPGRARRASRVAFGQCGQLGVARGRSGPRRWGRNIPPEQASAASTLPRARTGRGRPDELAAAGRRGRPPDSAAHVVALGGVDVHEPPSVRTGSSRHKRLPYAGESRARAADPRSPQSQADEPQPGHRRPPATCDHRSARGRGPGPQWTPGRGCAKQRPRSAAPGPAPSSPQPAAKPGRRAATIGSCSPTAIPGRGPRRGTTGHREAGEVPGTGGRHVLATSRTSTSAASSSPATAASTPRLQAPGR